MAAPLFKPLSYRLDVDLASLVRPLSRLLVTMRGRKTMGFALDYPSPGPVSGLAPVLDLLDEPGQPPLIPLELLAFYSQAAAHYQTPLGQALAWSLPAGLGSARSQAARGDMRSAQVAVAHFRQGLPEKHPRQGSQGAALLDLLAEQGPQPLDLLRQRWPRATALARGLEAAGWLRISHRPLVRDLLGRPILPEPPPERLSPEQERAVSAIGRAVAQGAGQPFMLYGVTGSGKTEVYLTAIGAALAAGRQALLLVPEIGLSLRMEGLLRERLGAEQVAALHSGLPAAARRDVWRRISAGEVKVVVGARSAVFAPLRDPGVICVDEEQDEAYKQADRMRYHARDLALLRGRQQGCPVVLGSATPAVTTYHQAQSGELILLNLPRRVKQARLPKMEVVDLRRSGPLAGGFLSRRLQDALVATTKAGGQAVLFLNRRGFAPALLCTACGKSLGCPACSLSLTWHRGRQRLICHTCGHARPLPRACPACGQPAEHLKPLGLGTEQVADRLNQEMPGLRVARLDRDTARDPSRLRRLLRQVASHEVDVVVGTQMITKGHHFPLIGLVGVLLADQALSLPDFRASERAYILLTQVAGRAGRAELPGRVIVQTYDPHHPAIAAALQHRPERFYHHELSDRKALGYPPFCSLVGLRVEAIKQKAAARAARDLARQLAAACARMAPTAQVLGPVPAPVEKAQGRFRQLLLLKAPQASEAEAALRLALHRAGRLPAGARLVVDVDPVSLL